ncbi:hypothetical protein [Nitrospira moscoviensis]|uniref:UspA domain-containing protein n=1 Tax=Nitrospira moscoviensis TaxID=42253 RepID=A0A0K2GI28_NITMO|nr:hypothetical protein [Nitrospira moscoviensis]ALA60277.1 hypothetical protein NITMOv2_3890 [Nitrospira moscoviensis]
MRRLTAIVVPTDFERPARRAFAYAVKLALVLDAQVEILHGSVAESILRRAGCPVLIVGRHAHRAPLDAPHEQGNEAS